MLRLCLLFALLCIVAGELRGLIAKNTHGKREYIIGVLSPTNGTWLQDKQELPVPSKCHDGWSFGSGYRGQTTSNFYLNGSWFLLGQESCAEERNTTLFGVFGPVGSTSYPPELYFSSSIDHHWDREPLKEFFVNWDWTCNIVVQAPRRNGTHEAWHTLQISEYDGQVRPQAVVIDKICTKEDEYCWRRVAGFSVMDAGGLPYPKGAADPEVNCGNECAVVTHEELVMKGKPQKPMNLVGRSFRTGKVMYNVTDPVQVQTLTFNRGSVLFLGLGICCAERHCLKECHKYNGDMVFFAWNPKTNKWTILDVLGNDEEAMHNAARIGVEVIHGWEPTKGANALVFWKGRIHGWHVNAKANPPTAKLDSISHTVSPIPFAWAEDQNY